MSQSSAVRSVSVQERRSLVLRNHFLAGDAEGPEQVVDSLLAVHATDPATVYLSVLARSATSTIADVSDAMYTARSLVRWMAMRRTLFLVSTQDVPMIQAAVSNPLAASLRRQLVSRLRRNGSVLPISGSIETWLAEVEKAVEIALRSAGSATGAELGASVPALRTLIPARAASDRAQNITSPLLTIMGTEGRLVRGVATGAWTSRHHRWQPIDSWWPNGVPQLGAEESERVLATRWLKRFGPATVDDLQWWTGWNQTTTRRALATLELEDVDLHGEPGIALRAEREHSRTPAETGEVATLLPSLDSTAMGWKHRGWYLGVDRQLIFDSAGNIGPTLWWNGEIIGSWAVASTGEVRVKILADRGSAAIEAAGAAGSALQERLGGVVVVPAIRTPVERSLA